METNFQAWVQSLRQRGLHQFVATLLEASEPLNLVGAQLVYLGQPVISGVVEDGKLQTLAQLLEEPELTKLFIRSLREDSA